MFERNTPRRQPLSTPADFLLADIAIRVQLIPSCVD